MKTSNKILLIATLIILSYLSFFNYGLTAEYKKGEYKNRFYKMTQLKMGNFTSIENNASNLYVRIEQGDKFEIWFDNELKDKVMFSKKNNQLIVDFKKKNDEDDYFRTADLIIICPKLENFTAKRLYLVEQTNAKKESYYIPQGEITISGFNQDSFNLLVNSYNEVTLESNKFKYLNAIVGNSKSSKGTFNIIKNNEINNMALDVKGKSIVNLKDAIINKTQFQLSDSADVKLSGRALKLLKANK